MSLQHVVLFSFPSELTADDAEDMRSQVASWPAEIGGMTALRFGGDITGERTRGYSRLLYMEFPHAEALRRYQEHPVHRSFQQWTARRNCTPLAFDYVIDADTDLLTHTTDRMEEGA